MTEGLKSEALFFEIYFFEKIPPSCLNGNPPPFTREAVFRKKPDEEFESLCCFFAIYRKKVPGKIPIPFLAQKERLDGFSTRRVRLANSLFYVPFCSAKRRTKSSSLSAVFCNIQKKGTGENPDTFFGAEGETRTLAPVTRPTPLAGAPRHQLEYFCIGSVYDTIRLLKERAEKPLSLLSGGESGIRTHGTLPYDGFQDRSVITASVSLRIRRKL